MREFINKKIVSSMDDFMRLLNICRFSGKKIVFTNGCFDILHRGHLDYLEKASSIGILVVGLNTDNSVKRLKGESRPINNENDRAYQLANLLSVDAVCFFEEDTPIELIKIIKPDVLVKGGDYDANKLSGGEFIKSYGGEIAILPFIDGYSTTSIINKLKK